MKILIIRVSAIGDVIHTIPSIFLIKKILPKAKIHWVVQKKAIPILTNQSFVNKVWSLPDHYLNPKNWYATWQTIKKLKQINWDLIIDYQGIFKTSLLIFILKRLNKSIRVTGFDKKNVRSKFSTFFTDKQFSVKYTNIIQKNLALTSESILYISKRNSKNSYISSPTIETLAKDFSFNFSQTQKSTVENWLKKNLIQNFIILSPNTTWPSKHWPIDNWKKLLELFQLKNSNNFKILLLGKDFGTQSKELAKHITKHKLNIEISPKWDLLTTAYLIKKSNLIIAPDTGILHLADFLNINSIGIFGPTHAKMHGPFLKKENINNAIQINCPHFRQKHHGNDRKKHLMFTKNTSKTTNCMYKLTPEKLFEKILKLNL